MTGLFYDIFCFYKMAVYLLYLDYIFCMLFPSKCSLGEKN